MKLTRSDGAGHSSQQWFSTSPERSESLSILRWRSLPAQPTPSLGDTVPKASTRLAGAGSSCFGWRGYVQFSCLLSRCGEPLWSGATELSGAWKR